MSDETAVSAAATEFDPFTPSTPVATRSAEYAGYATVNVFGTEMYILPDGTTFKTKESLFAFLHEDTIASELNQFEQYLRTNKERFFTIPGQKAKPERNGTGKAAGKVLPAREATEDRVMEGAALESAITRYVSAARIFKGFQASVS